ncbi:MAG TPA: Asp-tRNA(Asn)/Glu-tRNA(Gln) amidotransferase subunit GatC [Clostridia bacterium]|nr:Asp-tRNA(Asn)/Glu-tRNA(Gln) amidotransferase subunit GatC [Clostridia bacterium]HPO54277.1 Asp-tRNA(Asn)/Glu-tRNA(Gln) amidotransferase subunit GatC [Clostridia bacterium]
MITKQEVLWLAKLAKLKVEDKDLESLTKDMAEIVDFAAKINSAIAEGEVYKGGTTVRMEELRDDVVKECFPQEVILQNVGGGDKGFFPVKRRKADGK